MVVDAGPKPRTHIHLSFTTPHTDTILTTCMDGMRHIIFRITTDSNAHSLIHISGYFTLYMCGSLTMAADIV